jgi:hypothetical protein
MKLILFVLWAALTFSPTAEAEEPKVFKAVVSLQVLCSFGGPEILMKELIDGYNEKPVYGLDVSTPSGLNIQMYITENRNNPSSTILMHNQSVNKTCIFWSANDYMRTIETESLPAKSPSGKTGA